MTMQEIEVNKEKDVTCPHCKNDFTLSVKQKKPNVVVEEVEKVTQEVKEVHDHMHEAQKEDPHEVLASMLPKGVNFGKCKNGNCGKKIQNSKGIVTKFKTCPNCHSNAVPKSNDFCPQCGSEPEEFDESDIEIESEED